MATIVVAPDKFKGSLDAKGVTLAMRRGIHSVDPLATVIAVPMADGGEGTVSAVTEATGGTLVSVSVTGPLGDAVSATYGILGDGRTAVMEMAQASGLPLVPPDKRNPMITTTYGTGEMIKDAILRGCRKIVMGIGGSATNDGGIGMGQALGIRFLDDDGHEVPFGGASLSRVRKICTSQMLPLIRETSFVVACDVDNPLYGPRGAAAVYGPQKGASPEMVAELDLGLRNYAEVLVESIGQDVSVVPGSGAAGGLGAGLMALLDASLESGVDLMIDVTGLKAKMETADLVITGEGKMDDQTLSGKVVHGVARLAANMGIPVFAVAGSYLPAGELHEVGIAAVFSAQTGPQSLEQAMARADENVKSVTEQAYRAFVAGKRSMMR